MRTPLRMLNGLLLLAGLLAVPAAAEPLTDEDVVILFAQGTPTAEILTKIRSSDVAFDLEQAMLSEMRLAGVPDEVIQAMIARQAELHPPEGVDVEPEPTENASPQPTLRLRLNPEWKPKEDQPRPVVRVYDAIDPQIADRLRLRETDRVLTQLAIVLICRTADHVPDHWRGKTPLGRDFVAAPRHKLLAFVPGGEKVDVGKMRNALSKLGLVPGERDAAPDLKLLVLEVPETIEVPLEAGVAHDLTLGIAFEIGGRYYLGNWEDKNAVILDETGDLILAAVLRSKGKSAEDMRIQFLEPVETPQAPETTGAAQTE